MTIYLDWQVGDRIVCVDADPGFFWPRWPLVRGREYTVAQITAVDCYYYANRLHHSPAVVVELVGVSNPSIGATGFHARRFRKVQPRKTDIAIFKAMLSPKEVEPA